MTLAGSFEALAERSRLQEAGSGPECGHRWSPQMVAPGQADGETEFWGLAPVLFKIVLRSRALYHVHLPHDNKDSD